MPMNRVVLMEMPILRGRNRNRADVESPTKPRETLRTMLLRLL